jgi:large subunit ribosomal protein L23
VKDPHIIVIRPHITERSVSLSRGDVRIQNESDLVRKYVFEVATDSNKIEIKSAIEAIYNSGKKKEQSVTVTSVRTMAIRGKKRRRGQKWVGYEPDRKKAIITLAPGQMLEDYGV